MGIIYDITPICIVKSMQWNRINFVFIFLRAMHGNGKMRVSIVTLDTIDILKCCDSTCVNSVSILPGQINLLVIPFGMACSCRFYLPPIFIVIAIDSENTISCNGSFGHGNFPFSSIEIQVNRSINGIFFPNCK